MRYEYQPGPSPLDHAIRVLTLPFRIEGGGKAASLVLSIAGRVLALFIAYVILTRGLACQPYSVFRPGAQDGPPVPQRPAVPGDVPQPEDRQGPPPPWR